MARRLGAIAETWAFDLDRVADCERVAGSSGLSSRMEGPGRASTDLRVFIGPAGDCRGGIVRWRDTRGFSKLSASLQMRCVHGSRNTFSRDVRGSVKIRASSVAIVRRRNSEYDR